MFTRIFEFAEFPATLTGMAQNLPPLSLPPLPLLPSPGAPLTTLDFSDPTVVYHYTSMDVLLCILKHRELWSTSVNYLNDVKEYRLFLKAATDHIHNFAKKHDVINVDRFYEHDNAESDQASSFTDLPFITSFAGEGDSLTHWRSYCQSGNGVAIGFRTASLRKATVSGKGPDVSTPSSTFKRVRYIDPTDSPLIEYLLDEALGRAEETMKDIDVSMRDIITTSAQFFAEIQNLSGSLKHYSFRDEREFRLIVDFVQYSQQLIHYRTTRSTLVPYVRLKIPSVDLNPTEFAWDAIETITVGPTPNMQLSMDALRALLVKTSTTAVVKNSEVAYRDW